MNSIEKFVVKNEILFEWLCKTKVSFKLQENALIKKICKDNPTLSAIHLSMIKKQLSKVFFPHVKRGMKQCRYTHARFIKKNARFLKNDFKVDFLHVKKNVNNFKLIPTKNIRQRRKNILPSSAASIRTRQRRSKNLSELESLDVLENAVKLKSKYNSTSNKSLRVKNDRKIIPATDLDLAEYMNSDYTKRKWTSSRRYNKIRTGSFEWPSYKKIRELKDTCYPHIDFFEITRSGSSVPSSSFRSYC